MRALSAVGPQVCSFNMKGGPGAPLTSRTQTVLPRPSWECGKSRARTKFGNRERYAPLHPLAPTSWFFKCIECQAASSSNILVLSAVSVEKKSSSPILGFWF